MPAVKTVRLDQLAHHQGQEVVVCGWLYNKRSSGKILFLILRDGTGFVQAVVSRDSVDEETFRAADRLTQESSLRVRGTVRADPRAPGGYELQVTALEIFQRAEEYPLSLKEHGIEFLLDHRHLWLRTPRQVAIMRVRHRVVKACRDFLDERGFVLVDAPILTGAACEGTTTLFRTDYFGRSAYLTQSGQLYMEAAAMALGKVYCFGPAFRAEKSKTRRHLMEFWMVEPEMAFADLEDCISLAEEMLTVVTEEVLRHCRSELELLGRKLEPLTHVKPPFPRLSYDQAVQLLQAKGRQFEWGDDFGAPEETLISLEFDRPVVVHRYPAACKAFYMEPDPQRREVVLAMDVLAPEGYGEIIGGGQRLAGSELLVSKFREHHLPEEAYRWYLDLRRFGSVPHSGFGLGIERLLAWICGLRHVREAIPFPRMLNRLYP